MRTGQVESIVTSVQLFWHEADFVELNLLPVCLSHFYTRDLQVIPEEVRKVRLVRMNAAGVRVLNFASFGPSRRLRQPDLIRGSKLLTPYQGFNLFVLWVRIPSAVHQTISTLNCGGQAVVIQIKRSIRSVD